jgi:hypothetical protein
MTQVIADRVVDTYSTTGKQPFVLDHLSLTGYRNLRDVCDTIWYSTSHRTLNQ